MNVSRNERTRTGQTTAVWWRTPASAASALWDASGPIYPQTEGILCSADRWEGSVHELCGYRKTWNVNKSQTQPWQLLQFKIIMCEELHLIQASCRNLADSAECDKLLQSCVYFKEWRLQQKQVCSALNNNYLENQWRSSLRVGWSWWWLTEHLLHCSFAGVKFYKRVAPEICYYSVRKSGASQESGVQQWRSRRRDKTQPFSKNVSQPRTLMSVLIYTVLPQHITWTDLRSADKLQSEIDVTQWREETQQWHQIKQFYQFVLIFTMKTEDKIICTVVRILVNAEHFTQSQWWEQSITFCPVL